MKTTVKPKNNPVLKEYHDLKRQLTFIKLSSIFGMVIFLILACLTKKIFFIFLLLVLIIVLIISDNI